jgi:hypothetical protein
MNRRIAKLLLLLAFVGNLIPPTLAISAPPLHACCLRKTVPHCHESQADSSEQLVRTPDCCNQQCRRAVTSVRWARSEPLAAAAFAPSVENLLNQQHPAAVDTAILDFQSARAPPSC